MPTTMAAWVCYRDTDAMVGWLRRAFGFDLVRQFPGDDGACQHAELRLGDAVVLVQRDTVGYDVPAVRGEGVAGAGTGEVPSTGRGVMLVMASEDEVRAVGDRAAAAGGTVLVAPGATAWGNFRVEILDPAGTQWSFGTYRPGEPDDPGAAW
jgi:uncharacterized glyoxalase superfamily protein PhnB